VRVDCPPSFVLPVRQRMLQVVAQNLATNAVRYAGPGSTFSFTCRPDADAQVLTAEDDGAGVAEEDVPRLFERFYRADRARASRGSGLGLAIVKHIVTAAGGSIEARSAAGEGLHVECRFPRNLI
jgi:signal transduction histidine kinase